MKKLVRLMSTRAVYIEDMQLSLFIDEITVAINAAFKHQVTSNGIMSVWKQKGDDGLRVKLQSLSRRKRGQWAAFAKHYFDLTFLPHIPIVSKKSKSSKDDDDDFDMGDDNLLSCAVRLERFGAGLKSKISRTALPNGACCLAVTTGRRTLDKYVTHV